MPTSIERKGWTHVHAISDWKYKKTLLELVQNRPPAPPFTAEQCTVFAQRERSQHGLKTNHTSQATVRMFACTAVQAATKRTRSNNGRSGPVLRAPVKRPFHGSDPKHWRTSPETHILKMRSSYRLSHTDPRSTTSFQYGWVDALSTHGHGLSRSSTKLRVHGSTSLLLFALSYPGVDTTACLIDSCLVLVNSLHVKPMLYSTHLRVDTVGHQTRLLRYPI
jgi:hypothetical protein